MTLFTLSEQTHWVSQQNHTNIVHEQHWGEGKDNFPPRQLKLPKVKKRRRSRKLLKGKAAPLSKVLSQREEPQQWVWLAVGMISNQSGAGRPPRTNTVLEERKKKKKKANNDYNYTNTVVCGSYQYNTGVGQHRKRIKGTAAKHKIVRDGALWGRLTCLPSQILALATAYSCFPHWSLFQLCLTGRNIVAVPALTPKQVRNRILQARQHLPSKLESCNVHPYCSYPKWIKNAKINIIYAYLFIMHNIIHKKCIVRED